jgi:hypothetical protein
MARAAVAFALLFCVAAVSARNLQQWQPSFTGSSSGSSGGSWQPGGVAGALENYQQCGGMGGACQDVGTCIDAVFPGKRCQPTATCVRNTAYHWMCKPSVEPTSSGSSSGSSSGRTGSSFSGSSGYTIPGTDAQVKNLDVSSDGTIAKWKQCGGDTGKCKNYGGKACRDCQFQGTSCEDGYVCARIMAGFWQCAPDNRFEEGPKCEYDDELAPAPAPEAEFEEDEEEEEEEAPAPTTTTAAPAAPGGKCAAPVAGHEVDGKYLETVYLQVRV